MAKEKEARPLRILGLLFALAIAGAILFFQLNANSLNRIYQAEAAITPPRPQPRPPSCQPDRALLRAGSIGPEVLELQEN